MKGYFWQNHGSLILNSKMAQQQSLFISEERYFSVTEVNHLLNDLVERTYPEIKFEGEISELKLHKNGHAYLTIKDPTSQLVAVIWRTVLHGVKFKLETGLKVQCVARPNIYAAYGKLQFVISKIVVAGEGLLQKKFLELKEKLEKEGLFDGGRKRKLPYLPRAVGIVTSGTGAVIHDMMVKIRERMPSLQVYLVDVRVQGDGASREIAQGISLLNEFGKVDVIIVGRGGGSLEDLWAFNEETTVRAIFSSRIPIISAVGHEVDVSLSDLVADVRAPTPTAAAEMVIPKKAELVGRIIELEKRISDFDRWLQPMVQQVDELTFRLDRRVMTFFETLRLRLQALASKLSPMYPGNLIAVLSSRVDILTKRIERAGQSDITKIARRVDLLASRLQRGLPVQRIHSLQSKLDLLENRTQVSFSRQIERKRSSLDSTISKLDAINPKQVMSRGFSLVGSKGRIIRSTKELKVDEKIDLQFYEGSAEASVTRIT